VNLFGLRLTFERFEVDVLGGPAAHRRASLLERDEEERSLQYELIAVRRACDTVE